MRLREAIGHVFLLGVLMLVNPVFAETTVDAVDKYSWGANIGWINWQGDVAHGAVFTDKIASGFIWGANIGWITLGGGSPANGMRYSNTSVDDCGVNVDSASDPSSYLLKGYAWSESMGWINFEQVGDVAGADYQPRIEKSTGILKGYAWSANMGWIALESPGVARVKTTVNPTPLALVWVNFAYIGTELGTQAQPFNTLAEGVAAVATGGTIKLVGPQASSAKSRLTKAMRLEAVGGLVRLGIAGAGPTLAQADPPASAPPASIFSVSSPTAGIVPVALSVFSVD